MELSTEFFIRHHDFLNNKRGTPKGHRDPVTGQHEMINASTSIVSLDFFDGELVVGGFAEARYRQYDGHKMYSVYFRRKTGELIKISERKPGDY